MEADAGSTLRVPVLTLSRAPSSSEPTLFSRSDFKCSYGSFQALHIRNVPASPVSTCGASKFGPSDVQSLYASLEEQDKISWCIENKAIQSSHNNCDEIAQATPDTFLDVNNTTQRGYCSFLVQHSNAVKENLLSNLLPMAHLPVSNDASPTAENAVMKVRYGPCIWLFFGKNYHSKGNRNDYVLPGRPEHTDSVTHDGTWHYQLSGTKIWRLRPTTELLQQLKEKGVGNTLHDQSVAGVKRKIDASDECNDDNNTTKNYVEVVCRKGDVLVVNTRLWWHSTFIPPQNLPSISYARDFYFNTEGEYHDACNKNKNEQDGNEDTSADLESPMDNVDGTYAAEDIAADTILFTDRTMPNCELHRSKTNPNCQVVELENDEGGESYMAVVTLREIKAGEFFSILESSDEEEGDESEDEEELDDGISGIDSGEEEEEGADKPAHCLPCT
jgi:hypothetical protein